MKTLPDFIAAALGGPSRERAFGERLAADDWSYTSSARMLARARTIAGALQGAGIAPGERVALISHNRVDWLAAAYGTLFAGGVLVPIFATLAHDQIDHIFTDSDARLCFVESPADARRLRAACPAAPRLISFDGDDPVDGDGSGGLAAFERGAAPFVPPAAAAPNDLAVLIYTSGTTGLPKGVMLGHDNLISNAEGGAELLPERLRSPDAPVLSVLPFAHIYEFTLLNIYIASATELSVTQPDYLVRDLKDVRPVVMALVPRILERVLAGISGKARADGALKARLVPWALDTGRAFAAATQEGRRAPLALRVRYAIARRLVLAKIRPALGLDRLAHFVSGSAPLHRDIALTFAGAGIPIAEGYGLTETSPIVTGVSASAIRYGTVGRAIARTELRIAADGEIFVRGPGVMLGYYRAPEDRSLSADGWFATGDIGTLDRDGYLSITDRKKELIKTTAGKYVAPGRVEAALKRSIYIGQCCVLGDGRPHAIALIAPNWSLVRAEFGIPLETPTAEIAGRADVCDRLRREAAAQTADLARFEAVRRVALFPRDLTIEDGELSPTLKIKRRVVEQRFAALVERAYAAPLE
ncbi:MAG: long-chain fatty acid--CoA ligase [Vulcanimicrobiaceae bacterium]